MSKEEVDDARGAKRLKTSHDEFQAVSTSSLRSLDRSITPPPCRRQSQETSASTTGRNSTSKSSNVHPSPYQLTHIRDLSSSSGNNNDTIKLRDILGDPLIKECWQFNYLFNIDFLMRQFDEDVRSLVKVKVVHGSWKRESPNQIRINEACSRYPNVEPIVAYMSEPFGTHHSKMMVLIRHDDRAQVIIHTANMVPGDWANMSQGVWRSPLLPATLNSRAHDQSQSIGGIGSGSRFKRDLLAYLDAYGPRKTGALIQQLRKYDFSAVRAALIASVPSRQEIGDLDSDRQTLWGWPALKDTLQHVPLSKATEGEKQDPHVVIQISSIATLGKTDKWLKDTFFDSLAPKPIRPRDHHISPKFSVIFPTPDEIRRSLNGYLSGDSIHMKLQSEAQQAQLQYLRPHLCRWAGDRDAAGRDPGPQQHAIPNIMENQPVQEAGRRRAAPHIKTYVRFSDSTMRTIDWAMITSANLSTQAWGAAANAKREVRICSWEIGVLFWPDLLVDNREGIGGSGSRKPGGGQRAEKSGSCGRAMMVPCFKRDVPDMSSAAENGKSGPNADVSDVSTMVGFRMPYDIPLTPYTREDMPWCATASYTEPDWLGQTWETWEEK